MLKPKTVEITIRVRVPKGMSAKRAKYEINQSWYGSVTVDWWEGYCGEIELYPRFSKARVVR
jgi:hypothetical protein